MRSLSYGIGSGPRAVWMVAGAFLAVSAASAAERYVAPDGLHVAPYTNWATAATSIQAAVDAAVAGDVVRVTNGVYQSDATPSPGGTLMCRVVADKPIRLESVSGPAETTIQGNATELGPYAVRCVYLAHGAELVGFSIREGRTFLPVSPGTIDHYGAGVYVDTNGVVSNCVIEGCVAYGGGGGLYLNGGGRASALVISNCAALAGGGGGALLSSSSNAILARARLAGNWATIGGGLYIYHGGQAESCLVVGNVASQQAGGVFLSANTHPETTVLRNCTVLRNGAPDTGGVWLPSDGGTVLNTIMTGNTNGNWHIGMTNFTVLQHCCTTPLMIGPGHLDVDPRFRDGDGRLAADSPCLDRGTNVAMASGLDLDGHPRTQGGAPDLGAYEGAGAPGDPSLVLYFTFDGESGSNVTDRSGNGNHGIFTGGSWTGGVEGGGVSLRGTAGSGSIIRVASSASLNSM